MRCEIPHRCVRRKYRIRRHSPFRLRNCWEGRSVRASSLLRQNSSSVPLSLGRTRPCKTTASPVCWKVPYKQRVSGSIPLTPIGPVVQRLSRRPVTAKIAGSIPVGTVDSLAQLVEQLTFNQWVTGSSPVRVIQKCGCGGIGRRTRFRIWRLTAWGFKSLHPHQQIAGLAQLVEHLICNQRVACSSHVAGITILQDKQCLQCERSSVVEHHLAKVRVAGSNPVVRLLEAGVAELADAQDLKSCDGKHRTGSIPVLGI